MANKTAPRSFSATRHVGADHRESALNKAALPRDPAPALAPQVLRRSAGMDELDALAQPPIVRAPPPVMRAQLGSIRTIETANELETVAVGETVLVNTQLCADGQMNARVFYRAAEVEATGQSIATNKQDVAVGGWVERGRVMLFDGGKRLRGVRSASVRHLKVEIGEQPTGALEAWLKSRRMNVERSTQTVYDDAIRFAELLKDKVVENQAALALALTEPGQPTKTEAYISQVVGVALIPRTLMARLIDVPPLCTKNAAVEISRLFKKEGLQRLTELSIEKTSEAGMLAAERVTEQVILAATAKPEITSADVRAIVMRALGEASRSPRVRTTSEPTRMGEWEAKLTMVPDHKLVRVEFHDVPPEQIDALRLRLKALLESGQGSL